MLEKDEMISGFISVIFQGAISFFFDKMKEGAIRIGYAALSNTDGILPTNKAWLFHRLSPKERYRSSSG